MTEDPQRPQDDETPEAATGGDVAEPEQPADPSEAPADQPATEEPAAAEEPAPAAEPIAEEPAPAAEPAAEEPAPAAEPVADEPAPPDEPAAEEPAPAAEPVAESADEPTAAEQPDADAAVAAHPAAAGLADEPPAAEEPTAADAPTGGATEAPPAAAEGEVPAGEEQPRPAAKRRRDKDEAGDKPDVVPGAHLEPDLVLEREQGSEQDEYGRYADTYATSDEDADAAGADGAEAAEAPVARTPLDLAADARYHATGKRKTAVARVILKPGTGTYTVNGKSLDVFFPRPGLQLQARQPLETAGYQARMDVVAKIHGGGVSSQAGALRHGIARALTDADPALRTELKRKGFLTRDARVKERKKAGLKKARKRPQFSKR